MGRPGMEISSIDGLKGVLRDYTTLHAQLKEQSAQTKPISRKLNTIKKAILKYMSTENVRSLELPTKDLLILHEAVKKPSLSENYLRKQFEVYFKDTKQANDLLAFLSAVPEEEVATKQSLKHIDKDNYIETESVVDDE